MPLDNLRCMLVLQLRECSSNSSSDPTKQKSYSKIIHMYFKISIKKKSLFQPKTKTEKVWSKNTLELKKTACKRLDL